METARDEYELRGMLPGLACVEDESGSCQCQRDGRILQLLGGSTSQLFPSSFNLVFGVVSRTRTSCSKLLQ